jgi:hypothetical protein
MKIRVFGLGDLTVAKKNLNFKDVICFYQVFFTFNLIPTAKTYINKSQIRIYCLTRPKITELIFIAKHSKPAKQDTECTYNVTLRRVREILLPWKSNKYYKFLRMCALACAWGRGHVHMHVHAYPACNSYAPYCDVTCGPSGSTIFFDVIL